MTGSVVEVAVNAPLMRLFHYLVPEKLAGRVEVGHRVLIPFGRRVTTGVCVAFLERSEVEELKPIRDVLHPEARFDEHLLELTRWISRYYRAPWGEVLEAALPPAIRAGKEESLVSWVSAARPAGELIAEGERLALRAAARSRLLIFLARNPGPHRKAELLRHAAANAAPLRALVAAGWAAENAAALLVEDRRAAEDAVVSALASRAGGGAVTGDQAAALAAIREAVAARAFRPILLHGVTGSGKTEVYLRALREVLAAGRRGLVLVPEISLTPQIVLRFREGLDGEEVAVLHSMLSPAERSREWRHIRSGRAKLVIGARSAVFAPVPNLGLIVVDEEHDASYKQESSPRYNGRDVAVMRARMLGVPAVLGSATPSLESFRNGETGKYRVLAMPRRATAHDLPVVTVAALKPDFYRPDGRGLLCDELDMLIRSALAREEQCLLFLNRRGFATYLHCTNCGFVLKCPECDITLTFHKRDDAARCHYCGHGTRVPPICPDCDVLPLRRSGAGTEKIGAELARRYEGARIARLDRDTVSTRRAMLAILGSFARGEQDILVGTQMVAKGHDFPRVTLVGIVNADTGLHFPDFRSAERTFQLITQVSGRAGRGEKAGRVVIQTFSPDHPAIQCAAQGDYARFYQLETAPRRQLGYPPFGRLARILFAGKDPERVASEAEQAAALLRAEGGAGVAILGPAPSPIARIQGKYRRQVLLKSPAPAPLQDALERLEEAERPRKGVERTIDVDPQSLL